MVISVFDNASDNIQPATRLRSRGLLLGLDAKHMTATCLGSFEAPMGPPAGSQGSMQVLPNEDVLVGFGQLPDFAQYTATQLRAMHGKFGLVYVYFVLQPSLHQAHFIDAQWSVRDVSHIQKPVGWHPQDATRHDDEACWAETPATRALAELERSYGDLQMAHCRNRHSGFSHIEAYRVEHLRSGWL